MMKHPLNNVIAIATIVSAAVLASCSTTSKLGADDILYTGVKKLNVTTPAGEKLATGLKPQLNTAVAVPPNGLKVMGVNLPVPVGLWVYNHIDADSKGIKKWVYNKFSQQPVLVADVRPEVRVKMLDELMDNNGYFHATASYSLVQGKNKKKAKIRYDVNAGSPFLIDTVYMLPDTCHLYHVIDSVASRSKYLRAGERYCTDSLSKERIVITNVLRNRGYYFFRPDYIEYLADSTINRGRIALALSIARNVPRQAVRRYRVGEITTRIYRNQGGGVPDTTETPKGTIIRMMPSRLRDNLIPGSITFREGRTFSVRDMNRTQSNLSRLGIFSGIEINAVPDTTGRSDVLDVNIDCTFDTPLEASVEVNASSKSNSYLGPGITLGLSNRNMFGGGELFNVSLTGTYEWQTGKRSERSSVFNSYEVGITTSLSFPRLLAPRFIPRSRWAVNWTRLSLNADLLNRPHYFKLAQFNTSIAYDWQVSRHVTNTLTLFKLTYTNLMKTTPVFDSIMDANKAIAQSFRSQFIPQLMYSYTYDRAFDRDNTLNVQLTAQEAGNLFWCIYQACGKHGEKELFGTPFSQFVKGTAQVVYGRGLGRGQWLVSRVAVGAAHAYGNASEVPYSEQFYCGGANSVRAFTVRSIGPGSYRAPADQVNGYFDQTGTFKFEANVEYRFPIIGPLHGALFLDAGNVWLLKNDPQRPGGQLRGSTFFKDLALGTGLGLRLDISMLVVRGDLGIGIHAPYETGRGGYYNMTSFKNSLAFHLAIGYPF